MGKCKFNMAYVGICNKKTVNGTDYCEDHISKKCVICKEQATHSCSKTFQFVCGLPICDKEVCKIKHHPEQYKFKPKKWTEIYEVEVGEARFGIRWNEEIGYEEFKTVVLREVKNRIAEVVSKELNKNKLFETQAFGEKVIGNYDGRRIYLDVDTRI